MTTKTTTHQTAAVRTVAELPSVESNSPADRLLPNPERPHNLCTTCGEDFGSVQAFDRHRVGSHQHLYSEEHPEGRRCLTAHEMAARGFVRNERGAMSIGASLRSGRKLGKKVSRQ